MEAKLNAAESHDWLARTSFFLRSKGLQARRLAQDSLRRLPLLSRGAIEEYPYVLGESISELRTTADPRIRSRPRGARGLRHSHFRRRAMPTLGIAPRSGLGGRL